MNLGEGIEYIRRTDGFTLLTRANSDARQVVNEINMSDELFRSLVLLQQRNTGTHDPSLSASDLDRVEDYGYGQGGEV